MKFEVQQKTQYKYTMPVRQSINQCIFKPLSFNGQSLLSYKKKIFPEANYSKHNDYWGNEVVTFYIWDPHEGLEVQTCSILELNHQLPSVEITTEIEEEMKSRMFKERFAEYLMKTVYTDLPEEMISEIINTVKANDDNCYQFIEKLNNYIYDNFSYIPGSTHVKTLAKEAFKQRSGVCQDFTHIMLAVCRSQGIPARYVSGYIYSGEDVAMRGDSVTHAWVEVYIPSYGWIGFDPTNNMIALNQHICVAKGRDYSDITPLKGVYLGGGTQELHVSIKVSALQNEELIQRNQ